MNSKDDYTKKGTLKRTRTGWTFSVYGNFKEVREQVINALRPYLIEHPTGLTDPIRLDFRQYDNEEEE